MVTALDYVQPPPGREAEGDELWIGTASGKVYRWHEHRAEVFEEWWSSKGRVGALLKTQDDSLWVGTEGSGLYRVGGPAGDAAFRHEASRRHPLPSNSVTALLEDSRRQLWIGTRSGLCRFETVSQRFITYRHHPGDPRSLGSDAVRCLYEDRRKVLWIGHRAGVSRFPLESRWFEHYWHWTNEPASLGHDAVYGMEVTDDGRLWVATEGGLFSFTGEGFLAHPLGVQSPDLFVLQKGDRDHLWLGTRDQGLMHWNYREDTIEQHRHGPDESQSLPHDSITALASDLTGRLWIGTNDGLARYLPTTKAFHVFRPEEDAEDSLDNPVIRSLWVGPGNRVYVDPQHAGIQVFEDSTGGFRPLDERLDDLTVTAMKADAHGNLWIGTEENGVHIYHLDSGSLHSYHVHNSALPDNEIRGIEIDPEEMIWLSTGHGLARHTGKGNFRVFDLDDGAQSMTFHPHAVCRDEQGRLYFGGSQGLNRIDIEALPEPRLARQPVLTGLRMNGQVIEASADNPYLKKPIGLTEVLKLPFDKRSRMAFTFATLDYTLPTPTHFRYRLSPVDPGWTHVGKERLASYIGIPPGKYRFEVQASVGGDDWNLNSAVMEVHILPPWWYRTWWAMTLGAVTAILGIFMSIAWYVRRQNGAIRRQSELLANQRNRAEAALADELQRAMVLSSTAEAHGEDGHAFFW